MNLTVSVVGVCVGRKGAGPGKEPIPAARINEHGFEGDRHAGPLWTLRTGSEKGTAVFNERQWSAVSEEEVQVLSQRLAIELPLGALGENLRLTGVTDLSKLPCGTMLRFLSGVVLGVSGENFPCRRMASFLAMRSGEEAVERRFVKVATGLRGVVGWVETPGLITKGDVASIELPDVQVERLGS